MKAKTRTNQPVEFEDYDLPAGAKILGDVPMEQIKDAQGHPRFIEGGIDELNTKINFTYSKWSLSGSHLMIVVAGTLPKGESLSSFSDKIFLLSSDEIPQWILDKIYPTIADVICNYNFTLYSAFATKVDYNGLFVIDTTDKHYVYANLTDSVAADEDNDRYFRVVFDLLIDNEDPEQEGE